MRAFVLLLGFVAAGPAASGEASAWHDRAVPTFRIVAQAGADDDRMPSFPGALAIAHDRSGFLWLGSEAGLSRWDGRALRSFVAKPGDGCALPSDLVLTLFVDERNRVWTGSTGALAYYDPATDCIHAIAAASAALEGDIVEAIASNGAGGLWIGTRRGLRHLDATLARFAAPDGLTGTGVETTRNRVARLVRDRRGATWIAGDGGVARLAPDGRRVERVDLPAGARARAIVEASDGRIWIGTVAGGAFVVDATGLNVRAVPVPGNRGATPLLIRGTEAPNREIWFATPADGIVAIDPDSLRSRSLRHEQGVPGSLPTDEIGDVMTDGRGLVWVAAGDAIGFYNVSARFSHIPLRSDRTALTDGPVVAAQRMADGRIAFATANRLVIAGPDPASLERVPLILPEAPQSIAHVATPNGIDLFACVQPVGLVWIDRRAGRTQVIPLPGPGQSRHPFALLVDGERLWVGGLEGVWRVERRTPPHVGDVPWVAVAYEAVRNVVAAAVTPDGTRWFGSASGVYRIGPGSSRPEHFALRDVAGQAVGDPNVASMYVDRLGRLWLATRRSGLYVLANGPSGPGSRVVVKHFENELPGTYAVALVEDAQGNLWVGAERGLARIDATDFSVQTFTRGDGIWASGLANGVAVAPDERELLFGGPSGFTVIRPDQPAPAHEPPSVVVTHVRVGQREIAASHFNDADEPATLEVPSDANSIAVEFAVLDLAEPGRTLQAHRLDGIDGDWVRSDMRTAMYMNLAPGTYRLRLRGADHSGAWSPREREIVVRVAAAWYASTWFRALEVLALVLAFVFVVQIRTVWLRRRQRELESLVADRTRALVEATAARTTLVANLAHDLRTPLTSLRAYLERLGLNEATLSGDERGRYLAIAMRQAERLNRRVQELFDLVRLNDAGIRLKLESFVPAELVQDVANEFAAIGDGRAIQPRFAPGVESVQMTGDIGLMQRLIENLVDNAVRHTPPDGWIRIALAAEDGELVLQVADNGSGIDPADLDRIFDRYARGDTAGRTAGAGLGLAIVKRIAELHRGTVSVTSGVDGGAEFTVRLPLGGEIPTADSSGAITS